MTTIFKRSPFSFLWKNVLLPSIFLLCYTVSFAQEITEFTIPDSLESKTYEELRNSFSFKVTDSVKSKIYAKTYIAKATKQADSLEIAKGYELLGFVYIKEYPKSFIYYDRAIEISKNLGNKRYPALLYTYKGAVLSTDGKYEEALENHLKAIEYSEANGNEELVYTNKHNIGLLKKHLELYDEALQIFKECYQYDLTDPNRDLHGFVFSHYSLANVYINIQEIDSARKFNTEGYKLALKLTNRRFVKDYILINEGIIDFFDKKYSESIWQITKALDSLDKTRDKLFIAEGLFYVAKAHDSLQQEDKAIVYYKKVDSIFSIHPNFISSTLMDTYKRLYSYYRSQNDTKNEARYIDKALAISDSSKKNYKNLSNKIIKTFDRRKLLQKQQELNKALNQKDKSYSTLKRISVFALCVFIIVLLAFYAKQRQIKQRFQEFVQQHEQTVNIPKKAVKVDTEDVKKIGLAKEVIDQILSALDDFESKNLFIESDITLPNLSKRFKTNSAYLSKVVNTYKNKKFAEYLNDLRIEHAIEKIQTDKQFRLYTIKAIAIEVGFNNSQSFARAFKRKTGIKPSDFITQFESMNT